MTVRRFVGRRSAETPFSKRALFEESETYVTSVFKILQSCGARTALAGKSYVTSFSSSATFSCHELWFVHV